MKSLRFEALSAIRRDLVKVKKMLDLIRKREAEKLLLIRLQSSIFETCLYPLKQLFILIITKCKGFDSYQFFHYPVDTSLVVDYLNYIAKPMDFSTMNAKIERNEYHSLEELQVSKF